MHFQKPTKHLKDKKKLLKNVRNLKHIWVSLLMRNYHGMNKSHMFTNHYLNTMEYSTK